MELDTIDLSNKALCTTMGWPVQPLEIAPARQAHSLYLALSDDCARAQLYTHLIQHRVALKFRSRALVDQDALPCNEDRPKSFSQDAYLVVHPEHVEAAFKNDTTKSNQLAWSHVPYQLLGGTFMLALDEPSQVLPGMEFKSHDSQRAYCTDKLTRLATFYDPIATLAFKAGALVPLKSRKFDLADLATLVAVNYVARLFGFSLGDLALLQDTAQKIGDGLMHVNVGRHFLTDPLVIPQAKQALATLSTRCGELLDLYQGPTAEQADRWEELEDELGKLRDFPFRQTSGAGGKTKPLKDFKPLMLLMADDPQGFSVTELAIMVSGLVAGTLTNLRAAVCIAIRQYFELPSASLADVVEKARKARAQFWDAHWDDDSGTTAQTDFRALVKEAMRVNPPAPFVPRRANAPIGQIPAGANMVIAVGGGSWRLGEAGTCPSERFSPSSAFDPNKAAGCPYSMVFGGNPSKAVPDGGRAEYLHSCIGMDLAMRSVVYTVRQLMNLPGFTQTLDPLTGLPFGLSKKMGFICESYPVEYEREKLLRQQPLQTILPVRSPVALHAEALKRVLSLGAPFIEKVLQDSKMVHFASFLLVDNDSKLILFTAYDGDFDGYINHFAREFGPLFDRFFEHIEERPPMPIRKHAPEFTQYLKRFQKQPVGGYFFSAYPEVPTASIVQQFSKKAAFDYSDFIEP